MPEFSYTGNELALFATAKHWKAYWNGHIREYLSGDVLEAGAGLGANTQVLHDTQQKRWVCLEPDGSLASRLRDNLSLLESPESLDVVNGTLADLPSTDTFDAILYADVIEHIPDDADELQRAVTHLRPAGKLIILAPAHPWLYTAFDEAIGHHRRYTKSTLMRIIPAGLETITLKYLDSAGVLLSLANRCLLHQAMPTQRQIQSWDRWAVPLSRILDPLLGFRAGKSVLGIWQRRIGSQE